MKENLKSKNDELMCFRAKERYLWS
jgi:hypothetical protein